MSVRLTTLLIIVCAAVLASCGKDKPTQPPTPSAKPAELRAYGGPYYKGAVGDTVFVPKLRFTVLDSTGHAVKDVWVQFSLVEGDGNLFHDSVKSDDSGLVRQAYDFTGNLGYATVRAMVREVDTVDAFLRASVIAPGENGQGQYVRFLDSYATVKKLNGFPASVDVFPTGPYLTYANYEHDLGVVVMLYDSDRNELASDTESVYGVILDSSYAGKSRAGWALGSPIDSVIDDLGQPDTVEYDPIFPPAYLYRWRAKGAAIYTDTDSLQSDRQVFEIHIFDPNANLIAPNSKLAALKR